MPWFIVAAAVMPAVDSPVPILPPAMLPAGDTAACRAGPAALVRVLGLKDRDGQIRVELYPDNDEDFLASRKTLRAQGKLFRRVDTPLADSGPVEICVSLPGPGRYTLSVLHDRNGNGKLDLFKDGYGFPNNPKLGMSKPDAREAAFTAGAGVTVLDIRLNYWSGFGARPLKHRD